MSKCKTKLIRILDAKPIFPLGGTMGPILTPHRVEVSTISVLLMKGYSVEELTTDGNLVKLNMGNFDTNNAGVAKKESSVVNNETTERITPVVEEKKEEVAVEPVSQHDEKDERVTNINMNKKNQKNKDRKHINIDSLQKK